MPSKAIAAAQKAKRRRAIAANNRRDEHDHDERGEQILSLARCVFFALNNLKGNSFFIDDNNVGRTWQTHFMNTLNDCGFPVQEVKG